MARPRILPGTRDRGAAWGTPAHGEPRWPASLAILAALALYITLDVHFQLPFGPPALRPIERWLTPALEMALLVPLSVRVPRRHHNEPKWARIAAVALIAVVNLSNMISLGLLVDGLLHGSSDLGPNPGSVLFFSAINIWLTNVIVFALWYWELDRGGPDERSSPQHREPDFLFPQMSTPGCAPQGWRPHFVDYLYVSFTNATAFSPTDTMPLTRRAKLLMLLQATISLVTIALVAARAVNILN
ncbi:MAG TPA: hypothetical protein VJY65_04020 [Chloroflexota bacterium]|nr:hypothetical protein [Chloroflexota bacterium]